MSRRFWTVSVVLAVLAVGIGLWFQRTHTEADAPVVARTLLSSDQSVYGAFAPLPAQIKLDARKVALGQRLFNEPRLSADGSISCANCHRLDGGGVDRLERSRGLGGQEVAFNAPTVFNSGLSFRQFWDGRAATLEEQVDGPLLGPKEMGSNWGKALGVLSSDPAYLSAFAELYRDGLVVANVRDAIAEFERSLVTPNSRFDRFLRGDRKALNEEEQAGFALFQEVGCASCHQGMNLGANMYQKLGVFEDFFASRGSSSEADLGRFNFTGRDEDRHFFKVPSLRNVALTPPYLHDGSAATLEDVIGIMLRYQLGRPIDATEVVRLAAFLRTLTGEYQGRLLQ